MLEITTAEEFSAKITQEKIVLVDFAAKWCKPCKEIEPDLDGMNFEFGDKVDIVKVDVDGENLENVCTEYRVTCVPTFIFFKNGKRIHRLIGTSINEIRDTIVKHIDQ